MCMSSERPLVSSCATTASSVEARNKARLAEALQEVQRLQQRTDRANQVTQQSEFDLARNLQSRNCLKVGW
ncbi:unnamed protein product [Effrenium voratum]|uniref:Uncharacterized protein n=1 Tax=Effrenium voratum TaxID=2562239 RepID=A0AA36J250_9DINO|nr:unnamed protein product [Effrenium voratum]